MYKIYLLIYKLYFFKYRFNKYFNYTTFNISYIFIIIILVNFKLLYSKFF